MTPRRAQSTAGKATREQIIAVTLTAIQNEGLAAITIRQIAERAGVNVAAVNYHFGSKDALINEVLVELTAGLRNAFVRITEDAATPRQRLHRFLDELSVMLLRYPDVYRQAIGAGLLGGAEQRQYLQFLRTDGLQTLKQVVRAETGETDNHRLTLRIVQAIGGLIYPLLVGSFIEPAAGVSFADDAVRRQHVAICLQNLLGNGREPSPAKGTARRRQAAASATKTKRRS